MPKKTLLDDLLGHVDAIKDVKRQVLGTIINAAAEGALDGRVDLRDKLLRVLHVDTGRTAAQATARSWTKNVDAAVNTLYSTDPQAAREVSQTLADQAARELLTLIAQLRAYPALAYAVEDQRTRYEEAMHAHKPGDELPDDSLIASARKTRNRACDDIQKGLAEVCQALSGKGTL